MSVPAIIAMTNVIKKFNPPAWSLPLVAVLLGVATQWLDPDPARIWQDRIAKGVVAGLAAAGLYDVTRPSGQGPTRAV
nr:MAG TPA: holin [Caudoviricetes sp.]